MTSLRPAGSADVGTIVGLMRLYYAGDRYAFREDRVYRTVSDFLADPALGRAWLIELNGKAAGYAVLTLGYSFEFGGRDAFVDELYVLPEYRRRGLAARAMEVIMTACRELGVRALHLEVEQRKDSAVAFYRRRGFELQDSRWMTRLID